MRFKIRTIEIENLDTYIYINESAYAATSIYTLFIFAVSVFFFLFYPLFSNGCAYISIFVHVHTLSRSGFSGAKMTPNEFCRTSLVRFNIPGKILSAEYRQTHRERVKDADDSEI